MIGQTDPREEEALQHTQRFLSALEDDVHRANTESFTGTDEAQTVEVVVNRDRWLTGLRIEHGLLRLGAETVQQRIHEALHEAHAAATAAAEAEQPELDDTLAAIVGVLQQQFGDLPQPQ